MFNDLKQLKKIKGLSDDVKSKIQKAWTWNLITDEQFKELMDIQDEESDVSEEESTEDVIG